MKSHFHTKTRLLSLSLCVFFFQLAGQTNSKGRRVAQSRRVPIAKHLEILGFTLGKSMLADVEAKLGKSAVGRCSPEQEASDEVCYLADNGRIRVVFESGFSGGWKVLDGYKVIVSNLERPCYRECPSASNVTGEVQTEGGLKLGLTREELIALLGTPKVNQRNKLTFQWDSRKPMTKEEEAAESKTFNTSITDAYWDVQDTIEVTLAESKVVEFQVTHVVTY